MPDTPFEFPTPEQAFDWTRGLPMFQQQRDILSQFQSPETFWTGIQPHLSQAMGQIGRSGLPSSSWRIGLWQEPLPRFGHSSKPTL